MISSCNQSMIRTGLKLPAARKTFTYLYQWSALRRGMTSYSNLYQEKAFVDGKWSDAKSGQTFDVFNPYDKHKIATVPDMGTEDALLAIDAAKRAFETWRFFPGKQRSNLMKKWCDILNRESKAIGSLITAENGKPLAEGKGEAAYGTGYIEWYSSEARRIKGDVLDSPVSSKRLFVIRQPIGPVGVITPWNFPYAMIARKIGAALASGCTVVIKPAEDTPLSALAMAQTAKEAGIPDGVINVVTCSRRNVADVGRTLCESNDLLSISFTGSTAVGARLSEWSASTVKRMSLELGGHAPLIVFESADIAKAVQGIMNSKFRGSGQTCVCSNRIFVHESLYDKLADAVTKEVAKLRVGNGFDDGVTQGPLINAAAVDKSERHVKNAVEMGATILIGGSKLENNCFEPTVLKNVTTDMLCCNEETFGPVAPLIKFSDEADVLKMANSASVGLAGYFYSEDIRQIWRVAERLEVGMVGVNEGMVSTVEIPFGGVKQSGIGREGGHYGMDEYLEYKYICLGNM